MKNIPAIQRIESIDILRGLVMIIMTIDHARDFFFVSIGLTDPMEIIHVSTGLFFSRWLAHFCAPVFVLLAGVAAYLYHRRYPNISLHRYLSGRGLWLIFLEVTVVNFAWTFSFPPHMLYLQVIWAIGLSMIALSVISYTPRPWQLGIAILCMAGFHLLEGMTFESGSIGNVFYAIFYERQVLPITESIQARTSYPVLPWIGIITLGFFIGKWFKEEQSMRRKKLVYTGIGLIMTFLLLRLTNIYGETNPFVWNGDDMLVTLKSLFNVTKYPPSLQFSCMTLGPALLFLAWAETVPEALSFVARICKTIGKFPLLYYVLHLYALHSLLVLARYAFDDPQFQVASVAWLWGIAALTLSAIYPVLYWRQCKKLSVSKKHVSQ
jgi:uncharacterized membrane protein